MLRVDDVAARLSLSRATVNRLLATDALPSVKLGRARRVVARDLEAGVLVTAAGVERAPGDLAGPVPRVSPAVGAELAALDRCAAAPCAAGAQPRRD